LFSARVHHPEVKMPAPELGHLPIRAFILAGVLGIFACAPDQNPTGPTNSHNFTETTSGGYRAVFLPTLGGPNGEAYDLNSADWIVGQSQISDGINGFPGIFRATLWVNRVPRDLGTLGGSESRANAISESGRIVGEAQTSDGSLRPFIWTNGVMRNLGTLPGGQGGSANDINSNGVVVGWAWNASGDQRAFKWHRGVMTDLGTLGGSYSLAFGINSHGHIVGVAENAFGVSRAVLWKDGKTIVLPQLGSRDGPALPDNEAHAINDDGQIVGYSRNRDGLQRAVLWENGTIRDLGVLRGDLSGFAADINAAGHVVGVSNCGGPGCPNLPETRQRAFLWNGKMRNLGTKTPEPHLAWGINRDGDFVGRSLDPEADPELGDHRIRATLWTRE
jgi:probable HAF family extracellular repeat protein